VNIAGRIRPVLDRTGQIVRAGSAGPVPRRRLLAANFYLPVKGRVAHSSELAVRVGPGRVFFDPATLTVDRLVFFEIFLEQPYATDYRDAVVVDVGAHKGFYGAYAFLGGAAAVISYEPAAQNLATLERVARTFGRNGEWRAHAAAVGAEAGRAELHLSGDSWAHSLHGVSGEVGTQTVEVVPMAGVLAEARARRPRRLVVKIDAEGAEREIVAATPAEAWAEVDELLLELHEDAGYTRAELLAPLAAAGLVPAHGDDGADAAGVVRLVRAD
jgi:FkbM family methyltransferase